MMKIGDKVEVSWPCCGAFDNFFGTLTDISRRPKLFICVACGRKEFGLLGKINGQYLLSPMSRLSLIEHVHEACVESVATADSRKTQAI